MDARQFLVEFRHIASAPDGIKRLRELILALAFQGSLCEHDTNNTSTLVTSIEEQRSNHFETGRKSRRRAASFVQAKAPPYVIPEHWHWLSLHDVGHDWGQKTPDTQFTYIDVSSIDNQHGKIREPVNVLAPGQAPSRARKIVRQGTVIYATVRPYLLNIALVDREFEYEPIASTAFAVVHPWEGVLPKYVYYYLHSPQFTAYVQSVQSGIAYPAISDEKFFSGAIPVPPTKEQKRIVTKVDELMALCDKLEAQQRERETLCKLTCNVTLNVLANAQFSSDLIHAWERVRLHIEVLLRTGENVSQLRNIVFQLGVTGKLTKETLTSLAVDTIEDQRRSFYDVDAEQLRERGVIVPLLPVFKQVLFPSKPEGWLATTIESACTFIVDCQHNTPFFVNEGYYCIDTTCIQPRLILWANARKVDAQSFLQRISRLKPRRGDVLFSREGTIGTAVTITEDIDLCLGQRMMMFRFAPHVLPEFAEIFLLSGFFKQQYAPYIKGIGAKHLNIGDIRNLIMLIPSVEIQKDIVASVNQLSAYCDNLDNLIVQAISTSTSLSLTAISAITGIRIQEREKMKAPKTELVSNLHAAASPASDDRAMLAAILARNNGQLSATTLWNMSNLEIDVFYQQLRTEILEGWIEEPQTAYVREAEVN